jgi:hypothetical protein
VADSSESMTPVILWMALFVVIGAPFVYLIWNFINHALTGSIEASTAGLAVVGALGLWGVLRFVAARAVAWQGDGHGKDRNAGAADE